MRHERIVAQDDIAPRAFVRSLGLSLLVGALAWAGLIWLIV